LTTAPNGGNKKASVSERVGLTDVAINYDRPGVKGREGQIGESSFLPASSTRVSHQQGSALESRRQ